MMTAVILIGSAALCAICVFANLRRESFIGFVAKRFAEDAGADWSDPDGGLASLNAIPEQVDVSSSFRGN